MKKLIIGLLALLTCFACFAGCSKDAPAESSSDTNISSPEDELSNTLDEAADFLEDMYKASDKETRKDYEVVSEALGFKITWSADNDAVSIEQGEGETKTKIVINKTLKEDTKYVLKATLTDEDGNTKEVTFERTALKALAQVPQIVTEAPVEGKAYRYYVYQSTKDADLYFAGDMDGYYFKTTENFEEAVDLYVEYIDATHFNVYFNHETKGKQYIGVRLSDDKAHDNIVFDSTPPSSFVWNAELGTITTHLDVNKKGEAADYYFGNYSTHMTISASMLSYAGGNGNNVGKLVELVDKEGISDAEKIAAVKETLAVQTTHKVNKEIELVTSNDNYAEVSIKWSVSGNGAALNGNKLVLTIPDAESTVTLTATLTCGTTTDTKVFTLTLGPAIATPTTAEEIVNAAFSLAENETLPGEYTLTGVITKVNTVYSEQYQNVTVTISVLDKEIECYRMKGEGADVIKVGDTITVTGKLKNYNGKVEFDSACSLDSYEAGEVTPPAGGGDQGGDVGGGDQGGDVGGEVNPDVPENAKTATLSIADYATANNWANGTLYSEVVMDGFTITSSGTPVGSYGLNTGKYYTNGNNWRMYQAENASVVITANEGITIVSVKITYASEKTGSLTFNGANVASDALVTVNAASVTFGVGNTDSAVTNGQARIQAFEIVYVEAPQAPTYSLTLKNGNPMMGGSVESFEYVEGAALELPVLTAEGKSFVGWYAMDDNGDLTVSAPATMPAESIALFAVWEVTPYTLTIKQEGVEDKTFTFAIEYTNDILISVNDLAYVLEDNLPDGFVWEENIPETFELKDYTFTAISAEVPKYSLTIMDGNPKFGGTMEIFEYVEGAALELPVLTAEGKNFKGWFSLDGEGQPTVSAPATMPAEALTLYAVWEVNTYTLTIKQEGVEDKTFTFAIEYTNDILISVNDLGYVLAENLPADAVWAETVPDTFELKDYTFTVKVIETLSIEEALTLGVTFAHDTYSTEEYYISGIITSVTNTKYGNFYIADAAGNSILVYGLYNADGARYDAMETKPVAGDTVKLLSVVGCYSNAAQLKNATLVAISSTADADKVSIEKAALECSDSAIGGKTIELAAAGKYFSNVAIAWEVTTGNEIASIADNNLVLMNPDVDTTISLVATISCGEVSVTKEFSVVVSHKDDTSTAPAELAVFEFGANGNAAHVDGSSLSSTSYTENGYTLALTGMEKVYGPAYDAKGNSCIKLGTSSVVGKFSFTVADDVTSVVIKVAKYKANTTKINVNGTAYTLTNNSNDGAYDEIVVDTTTTKTVSFTTVSGGARCMVNSITFIG